MRKWICRFHHVLTLCCAFLFLVMIGGEFALPDHFNFVDESKNHLGAVWTVDREEAGDQAVEQSNVKAHSPEYKANVNFLGIFPVKEATVKVQGRAYVVPSGQSFGIKIYTNGVLVVGSSVVDTEKGEVNPAKDAGIEEGDVILKIDGQSIYHSEDVSKAFQKVKGKTVNVLAKRKEKEFTVSFTPAYSKSAKDYKAGLWVRDSTAGIGTLTYYDPENKTFAGLGHAVCDVDTGETLPLLKGEAVNATVSGCYKGIAGQPGSLCSSFLDTGIGKILKNGDTGIYGSVSGKTISANRVPVAMKNEIQKGPAQIITTVEGETPQTFDIEIERINYSGQTLQKNMVIRVTDPKLLEKTGGIVQGMSGSPILQHGKLVGAVTHVFVNNPKKGYGIFAENMLETSQSLNAETAQAAS